MKIAKTLTELIGKTPLVAVSRFQDDATVAVPLIAKLEYFNPGGSAKDRIALAMIDELEQQGAIAPGATLIEPTSGNTGVGLALVAASRGYHLILTMPDTMSIERRKLLAALGAQLELTPGAEGMTGAINHAIALQSSIKGSVIMNQFENPANPAMHYHTTAEEVWADTDGTVDIFVASVGTGGTVSGVGRRLKELKPEVMIVAVEPSDSPVLSGGKAGPHKIQGIGAGFVPKNYDATVVDQVITVTADAAFAASRRLASTEGILVGISSGAALHAALQVAAEHPTKRVVVLLPDGGERYLSTPLFSAE